MIVTGGERLEKIRRERDGFKFIDFFDLGLNPIKWFIQYPKLNSLKII